MRVLQATKINPTHIRDRESMLKMQRAGSQTIPPRRTTPKTPGSKAGITTTMAMKPCMRTSSTPFMPTLMSMSGTGGTVTGDLAEDDLFSLEQFYPSIFFYGKKVGPSQLYLLPSQQQQPHNPYPPESDSSPPGGILQHGRLVGGGI